MKIKQISPQNGKFFKKLASIALVPKTLYYYGLEPCAGPVVAIVGSRKMTAYGEEHAYRAAYELAKRGVVVISGLATGVDATAHRGALDAGGVTVGVLGTPIDRMYPRANTRLAEEIIEKGGMIMSECPPFEDNSLEVDTAELVRWHKVIDSRSGARAVFLQRNRLISGLADAVLIVEADERSGSLNTASHAFDQGRLVFALPGDVSRQMSRGCNGLFGKGAAAYTCPEDILDELGISAAKERSSKVACGDTLQEKAVIAAISAGVQNGEGVLEWINSGGYPGLTGIDVVLFNQTITMLEIKGMVRRLGANMWALR